MGIAESGWPVYRLSGYSGHCTEAVTHALRHLPFSRLHLNIKRIGFEENVLTAARWLRSAYARPVSCYDRGSTFNSVYLPWRNPP